MKETWRARQISVFLLLLGIVMLTAPRLASASGVSARALKSRGESIRATHSAEAPMTDPDYPGTAMQRLRAAMERARSLSPEELSQDWTEVRRRLLWACGLKEMNNVPPGQGNTQHCFNDHNHCDATTMIGEVAHNRNDGSIQGIALGNHLGPGIEKASDPDLGPGGSWCTCTNGANRNPPSDVAHVQFKSRVAFKLVWSPIDDYRTFVLVDDDGNYLTKGTPTGNVPSKELREMNFQIVEGGKFANAALDTSIVQGSSQSQ